MVARLTRAGISAKDILSMVLDGIDMAAAARETDGSDENGRRLH